MFYPPVLLVSKIIHFTEMNVELTAQKDMLTHKEFVLDVQNLVKHAPILLPNV
jgi:hypothetical protein